MSSQSTILNCRLQFIASLVAKPPGAVHPRVRSSPLSGVDGRPPFTSVSYEQAERLFRAAFAGRGVDDMLDEELTRINIKPGPDVVCEGLGPLIVLWFLLRFFFGTARRAYLEACQGVTVEAESPCVDSGFRSLQGVHTAVVKQGIYARLLRAAQAASQLAPRDKAGPWLRRAALCPLA